MSKKVLVLCEDNSSLSIIAQAILNKYLSEITVQSAGIKAAQSVNKAVQKALLKDGSWDNDYTTKALSTVLQSHFDLVIILSEKAAKASKEFSDETIVIQIEYEEPNYSNSTNLDRFIKTIKMELIPITRDVLEL